MALVPKAGLEPSGASPPRLGPKSLWRPQSPMFSEWGLQLAQGLRRKNKPCRKKKNNEEKKKNVLLFLKSLFPIADLYLRWKVQCSHSAATLVLMSLAEALEEGRPGASLSPSFIHQAVGTLVPSLCQAPCWAGG